MAGTRLWIQTVVLVQVILVIVIAFWFGLCEKEDELCHPILQQIRLAEGSLSPEHGSVSSKPPLLWLEKVGDVSLQRLTLPPVRIVVGTPDVMAEWKEAISEIVNDYRLDVVMNGRMLQLVCFDDNESMEYQVKYGPHLYVCNHEKEERIAYSEMSIRVYPKDLNTASSLLGKVLSSREILARGQGRLSVQFSLFVSEKGSKETSRAYEFVSTTLGPWMNRLAENRYFRDVEQKLILLTNDETNTLEHTSKRIASGSSSSLLLKPATLEEFLFQHHMFPLYELRKDFHVVFYLSSLSKDESLRFVGSSVRDLRSSVILDDNTVCFILDNEIIGHDQDEQFELLENQLSAFVYNKQGNLPSNSTVWHHKLWEQSIVTETYRDSVKGLNQARATLLEQSSFRRFSATQLESLVLDWEDAMSTLNKAVMETKSRRWKQAMDLMDESKVRANAVLSDPTMFGIGTDFPPEHALAVFAPLLLPLLLPMVIGWIKEFKRYKKLTATSDNPGE